jgi:5-(carboxyamino)imidazole ribonucleotide mutase
MEIAVIMESLDELEIAKKAFDIFKRFDVAYSVYVASAHKSPEMVEKIVDGMKNGIILAIAGKSAALPGFIASITILPVIGVPVKGSSIDNLAAILSMTQMPAGVPVLTVGEDAADNAALAAIRILALNDEETRKKLYAHRDDIFQKVLTDNRKVWEQQAS